MENRNGKVVLFSLLLFLSLSILSYFSSVLEPFWQQAKNVNIFSDITLSQHQPPSPDSSKGEIAVVQMAVIDSSMVEPQEPPEQLFSRYQLAGRFVSFDASPSSVALPGLKSKLAALKRHEKIKIRIAWFGDSLIEGDLITQTVRELLQNEFGGAHGVGFVPFRSLTAGFRTSATAISSGSWREENFKNARSGTPLFLSGHVFYSGNGQFLLRDNTVRDSLQVVEKWLICGQSRSPASMVVNGQPVSISAPKRFNRILLDKSPSPRIRIQCSSGANLPLYGVSSEPEYGVVIDNFSFRGISGVELDKIDGSLLESIANSGLYDLVVLQYGVNLMFRPKDTNYDYYYKIMMPVVGRLKERMPKSEFLLVSCSDRAFRYGGKWKSAIGLDSLVKVQARIAYENRIPFFNLYKSMGGEGTIVKWAEGTPRLAAKDYIHASSAGAAILGRYFFNAFMKECEEPATNTLNSKLK